MTTSPDQERRRSFRVTDKIALLLRFFPQEEVELAMQSFSARRTEHGMMNMFLRNRDKHLPVMTAIQSRDQDVAAYLRYLESKIDTIAGMMQIQELDLPSEPTHEVNLSATGLRFLHDQTLQVDEVIEMEMLLFPSYALIPALGKVVACEEVAANDPLHRFSVAVDFILLDDDDQDLLIKHNVSRQMHDLQLSHENDS
jgi:hypothetical protein